MWDLFSSLPRSLPPLTPPLRPKSSALGGGRGTPPRGRGGTPQGGVFPRWFGTGRACPGDAASKTALDSQLFHPSECNCVGCCLNIPHNFKFCGRNDCILIL